MYRGQDIGDLQQLEEKCLGVLREGTAEALFDILPHLSILRAPTFRVPVEDLLRSKDRDKRQFAVIALGILGGEASVGPLVQLARRAKKWQGPGVRSLERTLISALGDSGSPASVKPLIETFEYERPGDKFSEERRRAVVTALATLVQHGVNSALDELLEMLNHPSAVIRAQAANEMAFAFWHIPGQVPSRVIEALARSLVDPQAEVREAARSSLEDLRTLGNKQAQNLLA